MKLHLSPVITGKKTGVALLLLNLFLIIGLTDAYSQANKTITGIVTSSMDQTPIPGATIVIKGTSKGTVTDLDGKYSIEVPEGGVLVFSYLGFLTEERIVDAQSTINVALIEDITKLDEVVVVGYGTMKRSDLTGAVASVTADDIKKSVSTSLDQALQGRVAGVFVTQNTGQPGGSVSVRIRGINTFSNNEPLYVVDGVPVSSNTLNIINPNDIVSMEVLKDASATAIYGSRASNGVVLVSTNRGVEGKTSITYDGSFALQQLPFKMDVMNLQEYASYSMERYEMTGIGFQEEYRDPSILGDGTDWQEELFRTAPMQNHQLSISSGSKATQYSLSFGYYDQEGIAVGTDFSRLTTRLNIDNKTTKWLNIGTSISISQSTNHITVTDGSLINLAIQQAPDIPARNPDGSFGGPYDSNFPISNPLAEALLRENYKKDAFVQGNAYAEIKLLEGLTIRNEFGGNMGFNNSYYFNPTYELGTIVNEINESRRSAGYNQYWLVKNYLTYNNTIGEAHSISVMVGHEAQESRYENLSGSRTGFFTNDIRALDAGDLSTAQNGGSSGSWAIESYFGRANYNLHDKYLLTATYRADGSANFGPENRWGFFPSFSAAWKLSNETFMQNLNVVNNLKLRAGWGIVGNQNSEGYAYGATLGVVGSDISSAALQGRLANPDLKWEGTSSYNLGVDLNMFQNRVEFITDVYYKKIENLLLRPPYPSYVGTDSWTGEGAVTTPWKNIGAMENKGIEFTLNTVNLDRGGFFWKSGFIFSVNKNKVLKLTADNSVLNGEIGTNIITQSIVGEPIAQLYGYIVDGMFTEYDDFFYINKEGLADTMAIPEGESISPNSIWVGDIKWKDLNEDGVINEKDRTFMGDPNPDFQFSLNNYFSYKGFDLNIYLTGVYGNEIYNMTQNKNQNPMSRFNMLSSVQNFARIELIDPEGDASDLENVYISNPTTTIPRIDPGNLNTNDRISTRYVEDGSYLRIKNLSLGYTLPKNLLNKVHIANLRMYVNIQNLYTFTKYSGYDPEVGSMNQNMLLSSIDDGRYPSQRLFTFGINITY
ncbi:MAG: TonB-dependent receptor [Bacteroidales bacterium]|nr:TonB-dependent receptor [Bacteroidales bacterium]MBN2820924.1 TonB-dependent receptor [Bacteroidales bacterium]